jgi:Dolichyl-phosphate-mannose-protein mannosyltransferase
VDASKGDMGWISSALERRWVLPAALALCILRMWIAELPSSFWVDEMGTEFVVLHGADDPTLKVAPQVPASIYYWIPRLSQRLFGASEIGYRVPSMLFMAAALGFIGLVARRLIHPDAGWFAVFACLLLREFNYQAADARPYALGTCVLCGAIYFLIRWLDAGGWLDAALFAILAALLWRVHLIFWPLYLIFAIYAGAGLVRREARPGWFAVIAVFVLFSITLLPVAAQALELNRQASGHVVAPIPNLGAFLKGFKFAYVLPFCAAAALAANVLGWPRMHRAASWTGAILILSWWVVDPVCLFAFSLITQNSVYLDRYLYMALPGMALAATLGAAFFLEARYWRLAGAVLGLGVLVTQGHWGRLFPPHHGSDWRGAARAINRELAGSNLPVICPSPFIEAKPPIWRPDYPRPSFLYSHLAAYPVKGRVYPFPFESSDEAEEYARALTRDTLEPSGKFIIYGGDYAVKFWRDWLRARLEIERWRVRSRSFGDVYVLVFEKRK